MEKYKVDIFNVFDIYDMPHMTIIRMRPENNVARQNWQITYKLDVRLERKLMGNLKVLKAINANVTK